MSAVFRKRLASLGPDGTVRAVIMLAGPGGSDKRTKRMSAGERKARIAARVRAAQCCLPDIDGVIETHGGRRLDEDVNAFGAIAVETTALGFEALASLENVKAILEDQPIHLIQ